MKPITLLILAAVLSFFFVRSTIAQTTQHITYQGVLTDASQKPVNGTHTLTIKFYDASVNGSVIHSENFTTECKNGLFNVIIGTNTPLISTLKFDKQYWIGVTVDEGEELMPRTELTSVPSTIHADAASSLTKNAKGAVRTMNGKSGDLIIKGGLGTTVEEDGNTITITAIPKIVTPAPQDVAHSVTGTQNQVFVDGTYGVQKSGDVTLTLPQNIHTGATPQFVNVNLSGIPSGSSYTDVVVSNGGTLQTRTISSLSSGVSSAIGTANQINVSSATGNVTFSLPQNINTGATPQFANVNLTSIPGSSSATNIVVSNGSTLSTRTFASFGNSGWALSGNSGTSAGTNFIGTTDNQALDVRTNNIVRLRINTNGSIQRDETGDARGPYSVDLQMTRSVSTRVASGDHSTIGGGGNNTASGLVSTVGGGGSNLASGDYSIVGGGDGNIASVVYSTVSGGHINEASGQSSTVGGGVDNHAFGDHTSIGGGQSNFAYRGTIGGGFQNVTYGDGAAICGGSFNVAGSGLGSGFVEFVGGGTNNRAIGFASVVGGGGGNRAEQNQSFIGGGADNKTTEYNFGGIVAGDSNVAHGPNSFIGAGHQNYTEGFSSVVGGTTNSARGGYSFVGGGTDNLTITDAGHYGFVGAGRHNRSHGTSSFVGAGDSNQVENFAAIGGGNNNHAYDYSAIPGGRNLGLWSRSFGFNADTSGNFTRLFPASFSTSEPRFTDVAYFGNVNVMLGNVDGTAREMRFYEPNSSYTYTGTNYTAFKAQTQSANITYTLPASLPAGNGVLTATNSGMLSWASHGQVSAAAGTTQTINDAAVTANSTIIITVEGTITFGTVTARNAGTSFTITTGVPLLVTDKINYQILP